MGWERRGSGGRWRPLVVVLALLGLAWMHGLGTHGTVGPPSADAPAHAAAHASHQDPAPAEDDPGGPGDHGAHVMAAGLCLALLLVAVLLPGRRRRGLLLRLRRASSTRAAGLVPPTLRARPPDLLALGVCRC